MRVIDDSLTACLRKINGFGFWYDFFCEILRFIFGFHVIPLTEILVRLRRYDHRLFCDVVARQPQNALEILPMVCEFVFVPSAVLPQLADKYGWVNRFELPFDFGHLGQREYVFVTLALMRAALRVIKSHSDFDTAT